MAVLLLTGSEMAENLAQLTNLVPMRADWRVVLRHLELGMAG